jgi:hypothetical protein
MTPGKTAAFVSAFPTIVCDNLADKMPKISRFFSGRIFLRKLKLPFKLKGNPKPPCALKASH